MTLTYPNLSCTIRLFLCLNQLKQSFHFICHLCAILLLILVAGISGDLTYLYLFALEDIADAGVEGSTREHGGDRVRQIQNLLEH